MGFIAVFPLLLFLLIIPSQPPPSLAAPSNNNSPPLSKTTASTYKSPATTYQSFTRMLMDLAIWAVFSLEAR